MAGLMQNWPLTADRILDHAARWRPDCEIVARGADGLVVRTNYGALGERARRLASALSTLGVRQGERVGVLGANSPRALEAIYAAIGIGAVAHPIPPGLPPARLAALIDQAQDAVLFIDPTLLSGLDETLARCASLRQVVVMSDPARMPQTGLAHAASHDALVDQAATDGPWGVAQEADPCVLFHTVGAATGQPKGVVWPHRSTVLAALIASDAEALGFTADDVVMPGTPFWRSGAWGLVFAAPAAGCKLVLQGPRTDAASVLALMQGEGVTFCMGSPTEIEALADQMAISGAPSALRRIMVVGAPCPPALVERLKKDFHIEARSAWGMVEACGLGAIGEPGALRPPFGVELEIADAAGNRLPHDGQAIGRLKVRGPAAASAYFPEGSGPQPDAEGYLDTGDLAAIDPQGRVRIADRADEVMSIGGAWVSPRAIEAVALEHPATAEAAVIAFPDERGIEAPLLVVRRRPGAKAGRADYLAYVGHRVKTGQKPADAVFVDALPRDIAGRIDKRTLRERLERHRAQALGLAPPPAPPAPAARPPVSTVVPAPLLYAPELEPRATMGAPSEFAPIRPPAPAPEPAAPPAPAPEAAAEPWPAPAAADSAEPQPAPPAPVEPPAEPAPVAMEPAPPAPAADPAPAAREPEFDPGAALAAASVFAPAVLHEPAPAAASTDGLAEALAEPVPEAEPEPKPETPAEAPAAEAPAEPVEPTPQAEPGEEPAAAAEAPAEPKTEPPLALEPSAPADDATPFAFPAAPPRPKRHAPRWARIVLGVTLAIAFIPLLLVLIGVIGTRFELIDWRLGVNQLSYAWPFKAAMVGVVSGIVGVFAALLAGFRRLWRRALLSLVIPILSLAGLVALNRQAESSPPIHDVATDWKDPLGFSPALIRLRGPGANLVEPDPVVPAEAGAYMYRRVAEVNADTCPQARPVMLTLTPDQAYARAKAAAEAQGMKLVTDDAAHGRLEATAVSPVFRFKSDLALRVRPDGSGARVDMRAVSRVGQSDRGMNCGLIAKLTDAIAAG